MNYCLTLGLEIHIQVNSARKMFCKCSADIWQAPPNTHTCPTCLGLPGALPVPNFESVQKTQLLGLALNCRLNKNSHFDRKHYFYPDLPKGYQISQYKEPLCEDGFLELKSGKRALIERVHLEEDTAKSFHQEGKTLIDFNKSGISLIEIVTKPCFNSVEDAVDFCKKIQGVARVLNVSDADMEKGNMRLEANVSLRTPEMEAKGELANYKVEIKNINSFKFMEKAVKYEIERQTQMLNSGKMPVQENRGWDEKKGVTLPQREKEQAHDYRYFPDPDIPPMVFTDEYFAKLRAKMPELPHQLRKRFIDQYGLTWASADFFSTGEGLDLVKKFEEAAALGKSQETNFDVKKLANLIINKLEYRNKSSRDLVAEIINPNYSQDLPEEKIKEAIRKVLDENESAVKNYKSGKQNVLQFLVGATLKELGGKANVKMLTDMIRNALN